MLIAATVRLSNGRLKKWREDRKFTQKMAADVAGIHLHAWNAAECMRFSAVSWENLNKIANTLECDVEDICPEVLKTTKGPYSKIVYGIMAAERVLAGDARAHQFYLPPEPLEDEPDKETLRKAVEGSLLTLTFRERETLKLRYGLNGTAHPHTLEEIGKILKVSKERVRQIEAKAIRKLQHPVRAAKFARFMTPEKEERTAEHFKPIDDSCAE
ncbi:MAG: helix-turn-helix domain-containing protein [Planctomycetota bacterium]